MGINDSLRIDAVQAVIESSIIVEPSVPVIQVVPVVCAVHIPATSTSSMLVLSITYHYCMDTMWVVSTKSMYVNNVLWDFMIKWKSNLQIANKKSPKILALSKTCPPIEW